MPDIDYKQFDSTQYNPADPGTLTKVPPPAEAKPSIAEQRIELQRQKEQQVDQPMIDRLRGMQEQYTSLANQRTPVPRDPQFTQPPPAPKLDFTEPIRALQNPGVLIATLGSFFSRAPMTAAMNAGGAAMEAYHKGEAEVFAQKREEWKENLTVALEKNKIAMQKLANEWHKSDVAVKDRLARMQAIASGEKMETVIGAIQGGHFEQLDKILEGLQKAEDAARVQLQKHEDNVELARIRAGGEPEDGNVDATARMIADYKKAPISAWGMNRPFGQAVMAKVRELNPDYDEARWQSKVTGARAAGGAEPRADAATLTQLTKQNASIESFSNTALKSGDYLIQLAEKVDKTGIPVFERWIRAGRKQIAGDPDVSNFDAQMYIYNAEIAKILTNPNLTGVLTDSARHEVQGFTPSGATLGQIKGITEVMKRDIGFRRAANEDEMAKIKARIRGGYGGDTSTLAPASEGGWTDVAPGVRIREK